MVKQTLNKAPFKVNSVGLFCFLFFLVSVYLQEKFLGNYIAEFARTHIHPAVTGALSDSSQWLFGIEFWKVGFVFLIAAVSFFLSLRKQALCLAIASTVLSLFYAANKVYFDFFATTLSPQSFKLVHQVFDVRSSILDGLKGLPYIVVLPPLLLWAVFGMLAFVDGLKRYRTHRFFVVICVILFLFCTIFSAVLLPQQINFRMMKSSNKENAIMAKDPIPFSKDKSLVFGLVNTFLANLLPESSTKPLTENEKIIFGDIAEKHYQVNCLQSPYFGAGKGRNVVVINLEAFQEFLLGLSYKNQEVTPFLNELSKKSLTWKYIIDNVIAGGSSDAEFSFFTGLYPDNIGVSSLELPTRLDLHALPAAMKQIGYSTASYHGNSPSFWNRDINHPALGIESLYFKNTYSQEILGLGISDKVFFNETPKLISQQEQPAFSYVVSLSSHHPYSAPAVFMADEEVAIINEAGFQYLNAAHYVDDALSDFFAKMRENPSFSNTVFVLFGDHIAPFRKNSAKSFFLEHCKVDPESIRERTVMFMVYMPGISDNDVEPFEFADTPGSLADFFPTILHLLGVSPPKGIYGTHLFMKPEQKPTVPWYRLSSGYIHNGMVLQGEEGIQVEDTVGPLFLPGRQVSNPAETYREALNGLFFHQAIFQKNCQPELSKD